MRKQVEDKLMIIFTDPYSSIDIHLHPIANSGVNKVIMFYDTSDIEISSFLKELTDSLANFSIDHEEFENNNFDCLRSLLLFNTIRDKLLNFSDKREYSKIIINASTGYLPAIISMIDFCEIFKAKYELIFLRHDSGGNWFNKEITTISAGPSQTNFLKKEHLDFLTLLFNRQKQYNNQFTIAELIQFEKELGFMEGIDVEAETPRARKRLFDFLSPLYYRNFITKARIKRNIMISLNLLQE
jgi:hypothetical protein